MQVIYEEMQVIYAAVANKRGKSMFCCKKCNKKTKKLQQDSLSRYFFLLTISRDDDREEWSGQRLVSERFPVS